MLPLATPQQTASGDADQGHAAARRQKLASHLGLDQNGRWFPVDEAVRELSARIVHAVLEPLDLKQALAALHRLDVMLIGLARPDMGSPLAKRCGGEIGHRRWMSNALTCS
jgi:hypothetical protein